ncbi:MAG: alpha-L-arabinofuranosidase [Clostridiales bacterium]|nr:alpha-L-arabinofuranosidase [Clostridiales bacterium]
MTRRARITIHPDFQIGEISPRLFSAFLEPIGTMVNGSMYNPKHPTADGEGMRRDFYEALKDTNLPAVRMPGGNFVSGWQWKDSIGPKDQRKVHLDPAWYQYITNEVGHDEYLQWAEKAGTAPLYTVNLGTGTMQDAMDIVEYTNHEGGTYWSDLRRKYGHEKPYGVDTWYLGNEMDGHWQLGSWEKDPRGYGVLCQETSKAMKWIDPTIKTAVCGSSAPFMEHFPEWDEKVLDQCYDVVDYLSIHHYHAAAPGNILGLLGGAEYYEDFINTEIAMCDFVASKHRSPKKMMISFDEYGGMIRPLSELHPGWGRYNMARTHYRFDPERKYILHDPDNMKDHIFPGGDMEHMLSMASIQLAFLRHADRVKIGCMTGGLNALAASNHDTVWRTASHYAFMHLLSYAKGISMQVKVDSETFDMPGYAIDDTSQYTGKDGVNYVDCASAWDEENQQLAVFVINRNEKDSYPLDLDLKGFSSVFSGKSTLRQFKIASEDISAVTTPDNDEFFAPKEVSEITDEDGVIKTHIKPLSWNVILVSKKD